MNRRIGVLVIMLLGASVPLRADEGPQLPPIKKLPQIRSTGLPVQEEPREPAPPPVTDMFQRLQKLRYEREALQRERQSAEQVLGDPSLADTQESTKLRLKLGSLLTQIGTRRIAPAPTPKIEPPAPKKEVEPIPVPAPTKAPESPKEESENAIAGRALDPLALAHALYRAGNYQGAWQAFQLLRTEGMKAEEKAPLQYLAATCLRKLGKADDAAALYREVANLKGDDNLATCAQWQLNFLRWQREVSDQLNAIRARRTAAEKAP